MPASKIWYANQDVVAGQMQSMVDMFAEVPRAKKRKKNDDSDSSSSSSSSDNMLQSKAAEKKGTPLYHLARALDNMLSQAGLGGLKTWIEEKPSCQMLGPHEFRYELKDLPPFEDHIAPVWQRWCVHDLTTDIRRFEVPATTGEPFPPPVGHLYGRMLITGLIITGSRLRCFLANVVFLRPFPSHME